MPGPGSTLRGRGGGTGHLSPRLLSPTCRGTVSFTGSLIALLPVRLLPGLQHLCCITAQKTIPTLRQANCISFVSRAPAPEKPLELIHYAAFDSPLLRGRVEIPGALREGWPQGLCVEVWAHQVVFEVSSSNCFITVMCCFSLKLSTGNDVIKVTWHGIGGHTMVCLLWHLRSTLLVGPAYNLKYTISFKVA